MSSLIAEVRSALSPNSELVNADAVVERQIYTVTALTGLAGTAAWAPAYFAFGEPPAGSIPGFFFVVTLITFPIAMRSASFGWFRDLQSVLMLVLPFLLMVVLGGFVAGSAVIIWALTAPLAATLSTRPDRARILIIGYTVLLVASVAVQNVTSFESEIPEVWRELMFVGNVLVPTGICYLIVRKFVIQRDHARSLLASEQEKSENLLLNVLPERVATRLKQTGDPIAEHFESVSVLFADIVGFTPLSEVLSAQQMVDLLNDMFRHFDAVADELGVEKMRTIGDNYMAAAGVPDPRPDHAAALADLAIAIRDFTPDAPPGTPPIEFRIGINSGPVMAGVIGTSRYQYDLWGDTVNTAARMESHGVPGRIQVSRATADLLGGSFVCEPRGTIDIKGKAPMQTLILRGRSDENSPTTSAS